MEPSKISTPCHSDPDKWFSDSKKKQRQAKEVCAACPLQQACLREALVEDEDWGVWGGLNTEERAELKERLNPPGRIAWEASAA